MNLEKLIPLCSYCVAGIGQVIWYGVIAFVCGYLWTVGELLAY